jgi:hypothetical protein
MHNVSQKLGPLWQFTFTSNSGFQILLIEHKKWQMEGITSVLPNGRQSVT